MDIQESLLTSLYNLLVDDATLKGKMGGAVRLYLTWAPPNAVFPYIVHRIDMAYPDWSPLCGCTYLVDIWSDSPNATEALDIRERIMALLDGLQSSTGETTEYWVWIQTSGFIPESAEGIWHYTCQFNLKWLEDAKVGTLLKR